MGPDTYQWLMATVLITKAEDFSEHEEILLLQQLFGSVHNCCQHPMLHHTPHPLENNWMNMLRKRRKVTDGQETPVPMVRMGTSRSVSQ